METIKQHGELKYYNGAAPQMRELLKKSNRPKEFGNKAWACSLVLINYLESCPIPLNRLKVLEIGCGWGLVGVYLASKFNCKVTCTDFDEKVLPIVQLQANLNGTSVETKKTAFHEVTDEDLQKCDLIIGAEVCYSSETAEQIYRLINKSIKNKVKHIMIADPGRPDFLEHYEQLPKELNTQLLSREGTPNGKNTNILYISTEA